MPARSTVVSVLSKRGSRGIEQLSATQLLQLSGRAGRRGLDTLGHVVLCHSNYEDVRQAYSMLLRPADAISSHFCVSYNTALRLLATRPLEECRQFVSRSFGAFQRTTSREASEARLMALTAERTETRRLSALYPPERVAAYLKLGERRTAEQRSLDYLLGQEAQAAAELVETLLPFVPAGTLVAMADGANALLLDDAPPDLARALEVAAATRDAGGGGGGGGGGGRRGGGGGRRGRREVAAPMLLVLGDGGLCCAGAEHVSALLPEDAPTTLAEGALDAARLQLPSLPQWTARPDGVLCAAASTASAAVQPQPQPKPQPQP